jgi:hypothetical protein
MKTWTKRIPFMNYSISCFLNSIHDRAWHGVGLNASNKIKPDAERRLLQSFYRNASGALISSFLKYTGCCQFAGIVLLSVEHSQQVDGTTGASNCLNKRTNNAEETPHVLVHRVL